MILMIIVLSSDGSSCNIVLTNNFTVTMNGDDDDGDQCTN